jgi:hypothetical protein
VPTDVTVAIIGALVVLVPVGLRTMVSMTRSVKSQKELLELTKKKLHEDAERDEQKRRRYVAEDKRQIAFDKYDECTKELTLAMARSMLTGNDVNKLQSTVTSMEQAKMVFKGAREEYRQVIDEIANQAIGR